MTQGRRRLYRYHPTLIPATMRPLCPMSSGSTGGQPYSSGTRAQCSDLDPAPMIPPTTPPGSASSAVLSGTQATPRLNQPFGSSSAHARA